MEKELKGILSILLKSPYKRSRSEVARLFSFLQRMKFFSSMSDDLSNEVIVECCSLIKYEFKPADSYVMHYGDKAMRFYIIIKGKVSILVPTHEEGKTKMLEVIEMSDDASFGELGLNENRPRAASVYCKEPTHLLYLEKEHYLDLFVKYVRNKQESNVDTLKRTCMFSSFSKIFLVKLSYFFTEERVRKGSAIFREGQNVEKVFIVKEGEFRLTKKIELNSPHKKKEFRLKRNRIEDAEIAILSEGSCCNEEDLLNDKHKLTCTCLSISGVVLSIKKSDLVHKILNKETENTLSSLKHKQNRRDHQTMSATLMRNMWQSPFNICSAISESHMKEIPKIKTARAILKKKIDTPPFRQRQTKSHQLLKHYRESSTEKIGFSIETNSPRFLSKRIYNWLILDDLHHKRYVSQFRLTDF